MLYVTRQNMKHTVCNRVVHLLLTGLIHTDFFYKRFVNFTPRKITLDLSYSEIRCTSYY